MSGLTVQQRGDLAEQMLPTAAHLAVLVHGDGGPEDVAEVLAGLSDTQKNALIVVLAGLVDPEQPVGKALGWLDFNEHGSVVVPSWSEESSVRELAPDTSEEADANYVDAVAVGRFARGFSDQVTDAEFLEGIRKCAARGLTLTDVDHLHRWEKKTAENRVNRIKKRYQRSGRAFPDLGLNKTTAFTEEQVVRMRERAADGVPYIDLALSFSTTRETVRSIVSGKRYAGYGGPVTAAGSPGRRKASRDLVRGPEGPKPCLSRRQLGEAV